MTAGDQPKGAEKIAEYVLMSERVEVDDSLTRSRLQAFPGPGLGRRYALVPPTEDRVKRFLDYTDRIPAAASQLIQQ
ncbi:MAG: hypothetical protein C4315_12660, partial [Chloroflexota bacterium]